MSKPRPDKKLANVEHRLTEVWVFIDILLAEKVISRLSYDYLHNRIRESLRIIDFLEASYNGEQKANKSRTSEQI